MYITGKTPLEQAFLLLAKRAYASAELAAALHKKGFSKSDIAATLAELEQRGYLNDNTFAQNRVHYRAVHSKWGPRKIAQELKEKGLDSEKITHALTEIQNKTDEIAHNFSESAQSLIQKKFGAWPAEFETPPKLAEERKKWHTRKQAETARRINFLLRRGFNLKDARAALGGVISEDDAPLEEV